ncbi:glycine zipper 2TM domain-containing protein [Caulobacter hibisci]|uniref:17 kDa surface antigen n=1 Tax=Caulobacter hibisci TaxID=2035993 RepID=A0ABS0SSC5_9CAUL|nr:glycine zipper 2TM domain-containing protein [Caulobacter hibisci]
MAGTVAGAGLGAVAGAAVAGRDDRGKGAVIGGVAGALIGNQAAKGKTGGADCARAYGYYDDQGAWHASTTVARGQAVGYFDRGGEWVAGAPRGYYAEDGRWVQASADVETAGYYADGLWAPASAQGYYGRGGQWVDATASGYYDRSGRWVAGPATGRYDADGRWMAGQASGRRDVSGAWIADPQLGHYDKGRWVRGEAVGYYDARGAWISTDGRARRVDYPAGQYPNGRAGLSIDDRQAQLAERINRGAYSGRLSRAEAGQATRTLAAIERQERSLRTRQGALGPKGRAIITARLDRLSDSISGDIRDDR